MSSSCHTASGSIYVYILYPCIFFIMWYILAVRFKRIASKHKELITTPTQKDTLNKRINLIYILYKHTNTHTHIPMHARTHSRTLARKHIYLHTHATCNSFYLTSATKHHQKAQTNNNFNKQKVIYTNKAKKQKHI